jgi:hypothetical protein
MTGPTPNGHDNGSDPKPAKNRWEQIKDQMVNIPWLSILKPFGVSIACYLPAFLLVILSASLFKPAITPSNQTLTKEEIEQITEKVKQALEGQQKKGKVSASAQNKAVSDISTPSNASTSIVAQGYIDAKIKEENKELAEQAAKDEIEKLQSSWKGDLFSQITFPIVFAIASIFAAFAVKDILTEIIKDEKIKELERKINNDFNNLEKAKSSQIITELKEAKSDLELSNEKIIENSIKEKTQAINLALAWLESKYRTKS